MWKGSSLAFGRGMTLVGFPLAPLWAGPGVLLPTLLGVGMAGAVSGSHCGRAVGPLTREAFRSSGTCLLGPALLPALRGTLARLAVCPGGRGRWVGGL